jgi:hypothetical protein
MSKYQPGKAPAPPKMSIPRYPAEVLVGCRARLNQDAIGKYPTTEEYRFRTYGKVTHADKKEVTIHWPDRGGDTYPYAAVEILGRDAEIPR